MERHSEFIFLFVNNLNMCRYDYINSFILDYIAYSIHVSEVGGFYWYIIALQVRKLQQINIFSSHPGPAAGD